MLRSFTRRNYVAVFFFFFFFFFLFFLWKGPSLSLSSTFTLHSDYTGFSSRNLSPNSSFPKQRSTQWTVRDDSQMIVLYEYRDQT